MGIHPMERRVAAARRPTVVHEPGKGAAAEGAEADGPGRVRAHGGHALAQESLGEIEAHEAAELEEVRERELVLIRHLRKGASHGLHERPTVPQGPLYKCKLAGDDVVAVLHPESGELLSGTALRIWYPAAARTA